ncbi:MAG: inorganic triphosphatase [Saccharofermentanales bacterium]
METELKLRFSREDGPQLLNDDPWLRDLLMPGSNTVKRMKSVYYDTAGSDLQTIRTSLRLRQEEDEYVITIKRDDGFEEEADGLHQRMEWSAVVNEDNEFELDFEKGFDTTAFLRFATSSGDPEESLREVLDLIEGQPLIKVCSAEFTRQSSYLGFGDTLMEISIDAGQLTGGSSKEDFAEVEVELQEGDARDLFALGEELMARFPLEPEPRSKYGRCLALKDNG